MQSLQKIHNVKYKILLDYTVLARILEYQIAIREGKKEPGRALGKILKGNESPSEFITLLLNTKKPTAFCELYGLGDWNNYELSLLAGIDFVAPVKVFDNGEWDTAKAHDNPFDAHLLFVCGPLLARGTTFADYKAIIKCETFNNIKAVDDKYNSKFSSIAKLNDAFRNSSVVEESNKSITIVLQNKTLPKYHKNFNNIEDVAGKYNFKFSSSIEELSSSIAELNDAFQNSSIVEENNKSITIVLGKDTNSQSSKNFDNIEAAAKAYCDPLVPITSLEALSKCLKDTKVVQESNKSITVVFGQDIKPPSSKNFDNIEAAAKAYCDPSVPITSLKELKHAIQYTRVVEKNDKSVTLFYPNIDQEKYNALIEVRLLPALLYANADARSKGTKAVVTLPDIGCGQFAGKAFQKRISSNFQKALKALIEKHSSDLQNISLIQRQNVGELFKSEEVNGIKLYGAEKTPGLLQETKAWGDKFANHYLYKIVGWDPIAWPGNDFYSGNSRNTDDGVSAAATDICEVVTLNEGEYDRETKSFKNKKGLVDWNEIVNTYNVQLIGNGNNILIRDKNNELLTIKEYIDSKMAMTKENQSNKMEEENTDFQSILQQSDAIQNSSVHRG